MKLKKILKLVDSSDKIGIYRSGHFIGNFTANDVSNEFLECKIEKIWTGIIYYHDSCDIPNSKLNITLKVNKND